MRGASGYTHGRDSCESGGMNKHPLSERDICTKFITPHLIAAGWDIHTQIREEVSFTDGRIHVRGKVHARGTRKRADYILYYKPHIPIAVIEAKDNTHTVSAGIQQALGYADILTERSRRSPSTTQSRGGQRSPQRRKLAERGSYYRASQGSAT